VIDSEAYTQLVEERALEVTTTVRQNLQRSSKIGEYAIDENLCYGNCFLVSDWKGICPFGEIID